MILGKTHAFPVTIDFDHIDAGNVVYHPNYLILCERARNAALKDAGYSMKEIWRDGYALALVENTSKYLKSALFGETYWIFTRCTEMTGVALEVHQQMVALSGPLPPAPGFHESLPENLGRVHYDLRVKIVCVNLNPLRVARFPERLKRALQP